METSSRSIARVTCYGLRDHGQTVHSQPELEEAKANACLIAAAPELLDVAIAFLAWIDSGQRGFPSEAKLQASVSMARTALTKAKGGDQ